MTTPEPVTTVNLDQYGDEALPWSAVAERLDTVAAPGRDVVTVLGTVRADGPQWIGKPMSCARASSLLGRAVLIGAAAGEL